MTALVFWDLLCFHIHFKIFCSRSEKNGIGNSVRIAFSHFDNIVLPIQEHGISFHLCHLWFLSSLFYSFQIIDLLFLYVGLFLGVPLFDAMVSEIVALISLSDLVLLVYRNAGGFCVLVLYLQLYWIHWWALVVFSGIFRILCVWYHLSCKQGQFYFVSNLYPLFLLWFLWLGLPKLE